MKPQATLDQALRLYIGDIVINMVAAQAALEQARAEVTDRDAEIAQLKSVRDTPAPNDG